MSLPTVIDSDHTPEPFAESCPIQSNPSERDLYADVTIYDDFHKAVPTWFRISELTQMILANTSHIANHVRTLSVIPIHGAPGSQQDEATSSLLNGVASILPLFAQLTSFEIVGHSNIAYYYKRLDFPWHTIPETFCLAFQRLLRSQTLKIVQIRGIDFFPMSLLNDCKHIRLTIECCHETQDDKNSTNADDQDPVPFEHLSIQSCDETSMKTIASWIKTHGLRSLDYVSYSDPLDSLPPLLVACSNSLTDLRIQIDGYHTPYHLSNDSAIHLNGDVVWHYPFTLAELPHLARLTVHAMSHLSPSGEPAWTLGSPIPTIVALVSTAPPSLQKLSVEGEFMFREDFEQLPDPVIIWTPFIPLATHCSSASLSLHISTSFWLPSGNICNIFSPFTDYKGLTPYVQSGTVVMSDGVRTEHRAFDLQTDRKCPYLKFNFSRPLM